MNIPSILFIIPTFLSEDTAVGRVARPFVENVAMKGYRVGVVCFPGDLIVDSSISLYEIKKNSFISLACRIVEHFGFFKVVNRPDSSYLSWNAKAVRKVIKIVQDEKYDILHTISFPCSAHIIGYEIKQRIPIKWVANFYDPWLNNPHRLVSRKWHKKDAEYEKLVSRNADLILHISSLLLDEWKRRYCDFSEKMYLLPLTASFPERVYIDRKDNHFNFVHIGNLYGNRNSGSFLTSLARVIAIHPELSDKVCIYYVGPISFVETELVKKYSLSNNVFFVGQLPEYECSYYYEIADTFLAFDVNDNKENVFFPSKIVKYFYYQKPILGFTTPGSVLYRELKASHNYLCIYDEPDVESIIIKLINGQIERDTISLNYWTNFSYEKVLEAYISLIE